MQAFQGERSPAGRYDGDLRTAYVGVDTRLGERWLAGVAVARSSADAGWNFGSSTGQLTTRLTSLHPYLRWSDGGTSIWATGGGGRGSAENERMRYGLQEESGLGLRLGLVEVRRRLATVDPGVELQLRGDASWARLATAAGAELIDALEVDVRQLRVGVDVSRLLRTAGGTRVEPFGEVHARHDGGSGQTGAGLEVAGGLRVARGAFRVEGMGRLLGLHAAEGYREHGAAVTLSVGSENAAALPVRGPAPRSADVGRARSCAPGPDSVREEVLEASDAQIADVRVDGDSMRFTLLALLVRLIAYLRAASFERTPEQHHRSRRRHGYQRGGCPALCSAHGSDSNGFPDGGVTGSGKSALDGCRWDRSQIGCGWWAEVRSPRRGTERLTCRIRGSARSMSTDTRLT